MDSLNNSFWGLIQTSQDDMDNEIQVETIKRILTSCPERPVSKSTSLKAVQLAQDTNPRRRRNGCSLRSKSAPVTPTPKIKKRRYFGTEDTSSSPRKVHFSEMIDGKSKEASVSADKGVSETSLIDGLNKPVPNDQLYVENKENIDYSNTMVSGTSVSQEISVEQKEVMADADASSDDTEGNKQQARLRFQWSATKGLPAHILVVHLRVPFSQKLVTLKWHKEKKVFQSEKYDAIPVGSHDVSMIIAGREVKVEPLDVKFYTFEADVYLLEEEENKLYRDRHILGQLKSGKSTDRSESSEKYSGKALQTSTVDNASYHRTSKPSELSTQTSGPVSRNRTTEKLSVDARDKLNGKDRLTNGNSSETETCNGVSDSMPKGFRVPTFNKFSKTNKTKSSKMDETDNPDKVKSSNGIRRSKIYEKLVKQQLKFKEGQSRIGGSLDNLDRDPYSKDSTMRESDRDYEFRSSRTGSSDSYKESHKDTSSRGKDRYGTGNYKDSTHSRGTDRPRDTRSSSIDSKERDHQWSSRNGTESHSAKALRAGPHHYNSEQELSRYSDYGSHDSASRRSADLNMRRSNNHLDDLSSTSNRLTKDKLHDGYRSLDHLSDLGWSGTDDKYEHDHRSSGRHRENAYYSDSQSKDYRDFDRRDNKDNVEKYFSDSEVRQSRQTYSEDKIQSSGYEKERERYGQPQIRTPLVTSRTLPMPSRAPDHRQERPQEKHKEERVQDLEDTVMSLKQLLTDRDKELELLHCEKRKMELDMREMRDSTGAKTLAQGSVVLESQKETEKRINDLIREKENMATEIWQLKRDLDKAGKGQTDHLDDRDMSHENYDNSRVLHHKIEELESQVKDLQEVNETTAGNLVHTEKELDQLKTENEVLRKNRNRKILELEDDITHLKQQLERSGSGVSDDHYLRRETDRLREDLRVLRDKNHQLVQDNIKLTEHLKDLESRLDIATSRVGGEGQGERSDLVAECQRYRKEREAALEEVNYLRKELQKSRREGSLNRSLERDSYQNDVKLRSEDPNQSSLSQYRSHSTLVNGHNESRSKRERKHSGSDLSDSTAVLTTAHPGYHSDKDTFQKSSQKETDSSHRFLDANPQIPLRSSHKETIEDVLDDVIPPVSRKGQCKPKLNIVEDVIDSHESEQTENKSPLQNIPKPMAYSVKQDLPSANIKNDNDQCSVTSTLIQDEISDDGQSALNQLDDSTSKRNIIGKVNVPENPSHSNSRLTKGNLEQFDTAKSIANASKLNHLTNSPFSVVSVSSSSSRQFPDSQLNTRYSCTSSHSVATSNQPGRTVSGALKHSLNDEIAVASSTRHDFSTFPSPQTHVSPEEMEETKPANTSWTLDELSDLEDSVSCVGVNKQSLSSVPQQQHQTADVHRGNSSKNYNDNTSQHSNLYNGGEQTFTPGHRKRSNSVSSDCTDFLMSDVERLVQQYSGSASHGLHQHSVSVSNLSTQDTLHGSGFQPIPQQSGKANDRLSPAPEHNSSLRSVSPKPITTQHNKHLRSSPVTEEVSLMVANKRPFCPRNAADLHLDDLVKFSRQGGKISRGYVKYIGHLPGKHDTYLGVELEHEMGKHDGLYEGYRYFRCKPNKGVFVAFSKVVMAWGS